MYLVYIFSVLVNGSPTRLFKASRVLRQCDPLSPFLFTIVTEALGALLSKAMDLGLIGGFKMGRDGVVVTHLQFANDTILFSSTRWKEIAVLKSLVYKTHELQLIANAGRYTYILILCHTNLHEDLHDFTRGINYKVRVILNKFTHHSNNEKILKHYY